MVELSLSELAYLCDPRFNRGKFSIYSCHESQHVATKKPSINEAAYKAWLNEPDNTFYQMYAKDFNDSQYFLNLKFKNNAEASDFFLQWKNIVDDYNVMREKQSKIASGIATDSDRDSLKVRSMGFRIKMRNFCKQFKDKNEIIELLYEPVVEAGVPLHDVL